MRKKVKYDNMRRLIIVLLLMALGVMMFAPCVSATETSGTCGNGVVWSLSPSGTLKISGTGAMMNYSKSMPAPWLDYRDNIRVILIESGVTSVGDYAFYGLENVTSITVASSVKTIGSHAFYECRSLKLLTMSTAVEVIGESAFESCESLQTIRLPNTLKSIGKRAFYRCYSLKTITIPPSVTSVGMMVFAYCSSLVTADIRASISAIPIWMFYGCEMLSTVSLVSNITDIGKKAFYRCHNFIYLNYGGTEIAGKKIFNDIQNTSLENFLDSYIYYVESIESQTGHSSNFEVKEDSIVSNQTTVTTTDNAMLSTTVTKSTEYSVQADSMIAGDTTTSVKIEAVIENSNGWSDLMEGIQEGEKQNIDDKNIQVDVSLNDTPEITGNVLENLAGKDIDLTIDLKDGSTVKIDCEMLEKPTEEEKAKPKKAILSYVLQPNLEPTKTQTKTIGDSTSFLLNFDSDTDFCFSPKIYIGKDYAYQTATLYQNVPGKGLELLQSVKVDKNGYATYYLQSTKQSTAYLVALNVKTVEEESAIIPEDMAVEYGDMVYYESIQYVTTGVRMFMGLSLFQFSIAVFCVMLFLFVAVGVVMSILYRKKKLELYYQELKKKNA